MLIELITSPSGVLLWVDGERDYSEFEVEQNAVDGPATYFIFSGLIVRNRTINRLDFPVNVLNEDPATVSLSFTTAGGSPVTRNGSMSRITHVVASPVNTAVTLTNGEVITLDYLCVYYKADVF